MKMKITIIILILATAAVLYAAISYNSHISYVVKASCRNLEAISGDRVLMSNLWRQLTDIVEEEAQLENSDFATRVLFARDYEGAFGIDWEALGIPLDVATIQMWGEGLASTGFDPRLIDEIRVGYGYRDQLVFSIKGGPESSGPTEQDPSQWSYDLNIECRND